jgi:hypothetical protein
LNHFSKRPKNKFSKNCNLTFEKIKEFDLHSCIGKSRGEGSEEKIVFWRVMKREYKEMRSFVCICECVKKEKERDPGVLVKRTRQSINCLIV